MIIVYALPKMIALSITNDHVQALPKMIAPSSTYDHCPSIT